MRFYDIIKKKRDGFELTKEEIEFFAFGAADGSIPDYQLTAMLMAIFFKGMSKRETADLTLAMANSGDTVDLSPLGGITADKHSTGGVGDKTTLIVAPIVASCGVKVAKMSGRGLGHTGGTVDKLESIPGYKTTLTREEFFGVVEKSSMSVIGQSGNLAPADKKLYALRDVTATVDSIPLIASSIMSKKIAAGTACIVLDIKVGSGAFMKTPELAQSLAREMIDIGTAVGRKTAAVISNMDVPLGINVGNSLEVIEAVETLRGNGPEDLKELCICLAANMLVLAGKGSEKECTALARAALESGRALETLKACVEAQGGDSTYLDCTDKFPKAKYSFDIVAESDGYITKMDSERIGIAACMLGAGRKTANDTIDFAAGLKILKKTGGKVCKGDILATLYANDEALFASAAEEYTAAVTLGNSRPKVLPIIISTVR
ncbi:MAG: pyrimidine-nucleoside phosphorylase [Clostridia bacterium]|nr:pyrimidine-nucleoside phosphorylase [Clostridia bacterium]